MTHSRAAWRRIATALDRQAANFNDLQLPSFPATETTHHHVTRFKPRTLSKCPSRLARPS